MELEVFAVHDSKVGAYLRPFFCRTKGEAMRNWADSVNDTQSPFSKNPEDYCLFHLGSYNEDSGTFENLSAPTNCGVAREFIRVE